AERLAEALRKGGANCFRVALSIELHQEEILFVPEMIIRSRARVLDHVGTVLAERADDQVGPAGGPGRKHRFGGWKPSPRLPRRRRRIVPGEPRVFQETAIRLVEALLLFAVEINRSLADPAGAKKGAQLHSPLPEPFHGRVELAFMLFHEGEAAPLED